MPGHPCSGPKQGVHPPRPSHTFFTGLGLAVGGRGSGPRLRRRCPSWTAGLLCPQHRAGLGAGSCDILRRASPSDLRSEPPQRRPQGSGPPGRPACTRHRDRMGPVTERLHWGRDSVPVCHSAQASLRQDGSRSSLPWTDRAPLLSGFTEVSGGHAGSLEREQGLP